jgi:LL-diaminopimelate aminotransferase
MGRLTCREVHVPDLSRAFASLPPYGLADAPRLKRELRARGVDVIDLGAGDADLAPPREAVEAVREAVGRPEMSRYAFQAGLGEFREEIAAWMDRRFGVTVDPETEVLPLIGSKEGLAHLPLAYVDPGDAAVIPDPGYPPYFGGPLLAHGELVRVPLRPENGFLLDLDEVPGEVRPRVKLLYLNYPNNPTAATAPLDYLREVVAACRARDWLLVYDNAYCDLAYDGYRPPSILQVEGARDCAVEFFSLSKTFNMTGWRIAYAVGNRDAIAALARLKTFLDNGLFLALQAAGAATLRAWERFVPGNVAVFRERRDAAVEAFRAAGFDVAVPRATIYLWMRIPTGEPSQAFCRRILEETGVVLFPGAAMGTGGEGFVRVALTVSPDRLREAAARVGAVLAGTGQATGSKTNAR